jgi:hypothetical protein
LGGIAIQIAQAVANDRTRLADSLQAYPIRRGVFASLRAAVIYAIIDVVALQNFLQRAYLSAHRSTGGW